MIKGKRGISGVVVAILIVLIAVIAVSIFWIALRPAIERTTDQISKSEECLSLNLKIDSMDAINNEVKVSRDAGQASLESLKIIVDGTEASGSPFTNFPQELETLTYSVSLNSGDEVNIAGVLEEGVVCSISDTEIVS
tara:strand:- start:380 stop:793 length:414 start_codon:yes stop_codon:yes gene_type:complete